MNHFFMMPPPCGLAFFLRSVVVITNAIGALSQLVTFFKSALFSVADGSSAPSGGGGHGQPASILSLEKVPEGYPRFQKRFQKVPVIQGSHLCLGLRIGNFAKRGDKKQRLRLRMDVWTRRCCHRTDGRTSKMEPRASIKPR